MSVEGTEALAAPPLVRQGICFEDSPSSRTALVSVDGETPSSAASSGLHPRAVIELGQDVREIGGDDRRRISSRSLGVRFRPCLRLQLIIAMVMNSGESRTSTAQTVASWAWTWSLEAMKSIDQRQDCPARLLNKPTRDIPPPPF